MIFPNLFVSKKKKKKMKCMRMYFDLYETAGKLCCVFSRSCLELAKELCDSTYGIMPPNAKETVSRKLFTTPTMKVRPLQFNFTE